MMYEEWVLYRRGVTIPRFLRALFSGVIFYASGLRAVVTRSGPLCVMLEM